MTLEIQPSISIIRKDNWTEVVINKDGFVNGTLLAEQINDHLITYLKSDGAQETIEHIQNLMGIKHTFYKYDSPWANIRGWYIHPFLALEFASIKKHQDPDYQEYFEFLRENIFNWIETNNLQEENNLIYEFYHETGDFYVE